MADGAAVGLEDGNSDGAEDGAATIHIFHLRLSVGGELGLSRGIALGAGVPGDCVGKADGALEGIGELVGANVPGIYE